MYTLTFSLRVRIFHRFSIIALKINAHRLWFQDPAKSTSAFESPFYAAIILIKVFPAAEVDEDEISLAALGKLSKTQRHF